MNLLDYATPVNIAGVLAAVVVLFGDQIYSFLKGLVPDITNIVSDNSGEDLVRDAINVRRVIESSGNQELLGHFDSEIMPLVLSSLNEKVG